MKTPPPPPPRLPLNRCFRWIFESRKLVSVIMCANVMKCAGVSIYSLVLIMVVRGIYVGGLSVAFSCADASAYGFWLGFLLGFFFLIGGGEVYCLECSAMVVRVGAVGRVILSAESVAEVRSRYDAEFVVSSVRW